MALVINTNTSSLNAQRQLTRSGMDLAKSMERLSSGKRINSASDDAAGLAISNRMTSQVRGLNQAIRNANDGISMIQVAEGALNETTNILQRIRELSVQSSNGIYSQADRQTLEAEVKQLVNQLDLISGTTTFNGQQVLNGKLGNVDFQVGAEENQSISIRIPAMDTQNLGLGGSGGDLVGSEIAIDGNGLLTNSIEANSIKINGKAIGKLDAGSNVQKLLDEINNNIVGIGASAEVGVVANDIGNGLLKGTDKLTITGIDLKGAQQTRSISNTGSLAELAEKITNESNGLFTGSINSDGKLVVTSGSMATITLQDSTQGKATGISQSSIADPNIAAVVQGLTSYWISEAETLIQTYYGMTGNGNIALNIQTPGTPGGTLASVSWTMTDAQGKATDLTLNIDMADFTPPNLPNGGSAPFYNDRIIAHEMVHAVMSRNMAMATLPGWFTEGTAELIHGADERVLGDIALIDTTGEITPLLKTTPGSPATSEGYSVSYLAAKNLNNEIIAAGGTGIREVFDQLKAGASLTSALATVSANHSIAAWNSLATYEAHFLTVGAAMALAVTMGDGDTGSIAGSDYGHPALNAINVLPNNNSGPAHDFTLVIPSQYAGGIKTADAKLVLSSKDGEPISITRGLKGTDTSLANLGLRSMEAASLTGKALSSSDQSTALAYGDLSINDVKIAATTATSGLTGKIAAINAVKDQTGVSASTIAQANYNLDSNKSLELASTGGSVTLTAGNAGILGLNGIGITLAANDTSAVIATKINAAYSVTGALAYTDKTGNLHIFSSGPLVVSDNGNGTVAALALKESGGAGPLVAAGTAEHVATLGAGSINIRGVDVALTNLGDINTVVTNINTATASTGVNAKVNDNGELVLESGSAFTLALGDTNGLQSFKALGISFALSGTAALTDSDSDNSLSDEKVQINARLKLTSESGKAISLKVTDNGATATGLSNLNEGLGSSGGNSVRTLSVATQASAQKAIQITDQALKTVNDTRAMLGAVNSRLDFTVSNLSNVAEKTNAALSRIVDADYADETSRLNRALVIQQAAQAMLAQANSRPQQVLALLR